MEQFDRVQATFMPRKTDDLRAGALDWIGRELIWEAHWLIDDGEYKGEWAMCPRSTELFYFGWVPSGDLAITKIGE